MAVRGGSCQVAGAPWWFPGRCKRGWRSGPDVPGLPGGAAAERRRHPPGRDAGPGGRAPGSDRRHGGTGRRRGARRRTRDQDRRYRVAGSGLGGWRTAGAASRRAASLLQAVEHQALAWIMAGRAGVRVPGAGTPGRPPGVQVRLLPFGEAALEHFVYLERPEGIQGADAGGFEPTGTSQRYDPGSLPSRPGPQRLPTIGRTTRGCHQLVDHAASSAIAWPRIQPGPA
jgi:hypothetical protein